MRFYKNKESVISVSVCAVVTLGKPNSFHDSYEATLTLIRSKGGKGISESSIMLKLGFATTKMLAIRHAILDINSDIGFRYPNRFYVKTEAQQERRVLDTST